MHKTDQLFLFSSMELEQLKSEAAKFIKSEIEDIITRLGVNEKFLSPKEACQVFYPPISVPTLNAWAKKGFLQKHCINRKTYYKQSEIIAAGTTLKKYKRDSNIKPASND